MNLEIVAPGCHVEIKLNFACLVSVLTEDQTVETVESDDVVQEL